MGRAPTTKTAAALSAATRRPSGAATGGAAAGSASSWTTAVHSASATMAKGTMEFTSVATPPKMPRSWTTTQSRRARTT